MPYGWSWLDLLLGEMFVNPLSLATVKTCLTFFCVCNFPPTHQAKGRQPMLLVSDDYFSHLQKVDSV